MFFNRFTAEPYGNGRLYTIAEGDNHIEIVMVYIATYLTFTLLAN